MNRKQSKIEISFCRTAKRQECVGGLWTEKIRDSKLIDYVEEVGDGDIRERVRRVGSAFPHFLVLS